MSKSNDDEIAMISGFIDDLMFAISDTRYLVVTVNVRSELNTIPNTDNNDTHDSRIRLVIEDIVHNTHPFHFTSDSESISPLLQP